MNNHIFSRSMALCFVLATGTAAFAAPAKSSVPTDLVGTWRWTTISGSTYTDTTTGRTDGGGGMSVAFNFAKDGHYTFSFYVKMRTYNLVTESSSTHEGTVAFSNGKFTLKPTKGHYVGWNNGKKTVDRDMNADELKKNTDYLWKWTEKENGRALMIGPTASSLSQFKPED